MGDFDRCMRCGRYLPSTTNVGAPVCGACAATPPEPAAPGRDEVPAEVHERGWQWRPVGDGAFAPPYGTVRACIDCGCLVAGGPTRCGRCAAEPAAPAPEPDEAERVAAAWLVDKGAFIPRVEQVTDMLRAAERRGWERACEEAEKAVAKVASVHRMRMQAIADDSDRADAEAVDDDIAIEEVKADAVEYAASRVRALRERGPR